MTLTLRVLQAPEGVPETGTLRLDPAAGPVTIGRGPDNDWVLPDPERHVSKLHCRIEAGADGFYLVDLSSNGVVFASEGRPVGRGNRRALDAGDSFRIGDYRIGIGREVPASRTEPYPEPSGVGREGGVAAILAGTSDASETRAARGLGGPASDWLAAVPGGAAEAQAVLPYGWQAPPATALTDLPEAEADAFSDFASRSEHVAPINEALQLAPARAVLPADWHLDDGSGRAAGTAGARRDVVAAGAPAPEWGEACAALIEGTGLGGLAPPAATADRAALVRAGQLLRRLVDVLATVEAVQRKTERDLGLDRDPANRDPLEQDLLEQDLPTLVAGLLAAGGADAGDRLGARLAGAARDARAFGVAVAEAADVVGTQIAPDAIEDAAREANRLAVGPLLKAAAWERYRAVHANLAAGGSAADAVLAPLRAIHARRT